MKKIIATLAVLVPSVASAQAITDVNTLTQKFTNLGNTFLGVLIAVAVIWIIFNTVRFIVKADSDDRKKYQSAILWGILGLFIILSVWGLVRILTNTFNTGSNNAPTQQFPVVDYPPKTY